MISSHIIRDFIGACESLLIYEAIVQEKLIIGTEEPIKEHGLIAQCNDLLTALVLYSRRNDIERVLTQIRIPEMKITVRGQPYRTITTNPKNTRNPMTHPNIQIPVLSEDTKRRISERSQRHDQLLRAIGQNSVAVTLHDSNENTGFMYLDIFAPIPARLNKQKEEVLGQPCDVVDLVISEPRIHAINQTIKTGQHTCYQYTYEDQYRWIFDVTVAPLYGTEEIITIVSDSNDWQKGHWLNQINN